MKKRKGYDWLITAVYILMVLVCVFMNLTGSQNEGLSNILVNAAMFLIVGIIFINCDINSFIPTNSVINDLENAVGKIRNDALNSRDYLFKAYKEKEDLFTDSFLSEKYRDFIYDMERNSGDKDNYFRTEIEDYINTGMADELMHRNQLNQVAGVMTGLGILGTFIGLSLGLQSFNTGTTQEVTESIGPLMNGIKVAFHTSIYGMIFSLVFNYVYKKKLFDIETAIERFLSSYKKYVLPDTSKDGTNKSLELQTDLLEEIKGLKETVNSYILASSRTQAEGVRVIVERFLSQMDMSLGGVFDKMKEVVNDQYTVQKENASLLKSTCDEISGGARNLDEINASTLRLISAYNDYTKSVTSIQNLISSNMRMLGEEQENLEKLFKRQEDLMDEGGKNLQKIEGLTEAVNDLTDAMDDLREEMGPKSRKAVKR